MTQKKLREEYGIHIQYQVVLAPTLKHKFYAGQIVSKEYRSIYNPTISNGSNDIIGYKYFDTYEEGLKEAIKFCKSYIKSL